MDLDAQQKIIAAQRDPSWDATDSDKTVQLMNHYQVPIEYQQRVLSGINQTREILKAQSANALAAQKNFPLFSPAGISQCFSIWISEEPTPQYSVAKQPEPVLAQLLRERTIERHPFLRGASLDIALSAIDIGLANDDPRSFPVDGGPPQAEGLAYTQSQTHRHDAHRPKRFGNVFQDSTELLRGQKL